MAKDYLMIIVQDVANNNGWQLSWGDIKFTTKSSSTASTDVKSPTQNKVRVWHSLPASHDLGGFVFSLWLYLHCQPINAYQVPNKFRLWKTSMNNAFIRKFTTHWYSHVFIYPHSRHLIKISNLRFCGKSRKVSNGACDFQVILKETILTPLMGVWAGTGGRGFSWAGGAAGTVVSRRLVVSVGLWRPGAPVGGMVRGSNWISCKRAQNQIKFTLRINSTFAPNNDGEAVK